jgi:hypothetical protein
VKKEMDLLRVSVVQIGQLVQNSLKMNGIGAKCKQQAERAEADRYNLYNSPVQRGARDIFFWRPP